MTQMMPPDYGIVDNCAFYHVEVVVGAKPARVGDRVYCDGIPNTDGGRYEWRLVRLELAAPPPVRSRACVFLTTTGCEHRSRCRLVKQGGRRAVACF